MRSRRARQRGQQRRLAERELVRRLPEPRERRRADAFEVAAEGREIEVAREQHVLGQVPDELERAQRLDRLRAQRARPRLGHARELHRDGGGARDDAAGAQVVGDGARERQRIHAGVTAEAVVLGRDDRAPQRRPDFLERERQAQDAVGRQEDAQRRAVAREHHARRRPHQALEREGEGAVEREQRRRQRGQRRDAEPERAHEPPHQRAFTSSSPRSPVARKLASYIASACAGGSRNFPGVTARSSAR